MDLLERHVPARAKLSGIAIEDFVGDGPTRVVTLTIMGVGQDYSQMGALLESLDRSGGRFDADPVTNGPRSDSPEFDFVIRVRYRPGVGAAEPEAPPKRPEGDGGTDG